MCGAFNPADPQEKDPEKKYAASKGHCSLCESEGVGVRGLNCGHFFCTNCWRLYVKQKITGEATWFVHGIFFLRD